MEPTFQEDDVVTGSSDAVLEKATSTAGSRLAGKAGMVGLLTLLSRFAGLVRDGVIAYVLGTNAAADAFYVAFRIPNLLRRMFAEGNLTLSFVPVFTESLHRSRQEAKEVADVTFTLLLILLSVVTLMGVMGAGWFVRFTALGFTGDPEKFSLAVRLTRITFPYIFLVSLGALMMGILNTCKHFAAPAFSPVLLNLGIILGAFLFSPYFKNPAVGIAWGVLLGGVLQWCIQVPFVMRQGFFPRLKFAFKNPAVKKIRRLMLPTLWGSAVYQFNLLAITFMASYLPTGSVSYLWYAGRVVEFPLGIFAVSLATVALPVLSDHAAKRNPLRMKEILREALTMVWLLSIPAAIGLTVLARPVLSVLFFRGGFTIASTDFTAQALQFFALGLPFISATRIIASAFYAVQEAKKPVVAANISVLVNVLAGAALLVPFQYRGLALSVSLGSITNFVLLIYFYRRKIGALGLKAMAFNLLKILTAGGVMAIGLLAVQHYWDFTFAPFWLRLVYLGTLLLAGTSVYFMLVWSFRVEGLKPLIRLLRSKGFSLDQMRHPD